MNNIKTAAAPTNTMKEVKKMNLHLLLSDLKEVNKELKKTWINERTVKNANNLRIEVKDSIASFTIVSYRLEATYKIKVMDASDGLVAIPYIEFDKLVRKLKSDFVTIASEQSNTIVSLSTNRNEFKFDNLINGYRELYNVDYNNTNYFSVPLKEFKELLQQPLKVVSKHESRPVLTGVNFMLTEDLLTVVATDSHRLARNKLEVYNQKKYNFILPGTELSKVLRLQFDDTININISEDFVSFTDRKLEVNFRRIEGNYPATEKLIPYNFNATFEVNRKDLLNDLELSKIMIGKKHSNVVHMLASDKSITLLNQLAGVKSEVTPVNFESNESERVDFAFNPDYMIDTLKEITSERVVIKFVSRLRPFIVNDPTNKTLDNLITPIRTKEAGVYNG